MNVNKNAVGIATCVGIVLTMFFFISNDAAYLDKSPGIQKAFEVLAWVCLVGTILSFIVWFNADGRRK